MTTPKKKKPIDLSTCKVGQRLKMRNGDTILFADTSGGSVYPYFGDDGVSRTVTGRCYVSSSSSRDIVEILSLPKRKPAKRDTQAAPRRLIAEFKAGVDVFSKKIERLEGLLK